MDNKYSAAFNRLMNALEPICKEYDRPKWMFVIDALWSYLRYGVTPNEYIGWAFYKMSSMMRKRFYTARDSDRYEKQFNDQHYSNFFNNKVETNRCFSKFISREWIFLPESSINDVEDFLRRHNKIIVKPIGLSSGRGIFTIENDGGITIDILANALGGEVFSNSILIEEFVKQHPQMSLLNPSSVNTIRVFTVYNPKSNNVTFLSASVRVGGKGADVDNYHAGGVGYPIDIVSGVISGVGTGIDGKEYIFHPSTGFQVVGFKIPRWTELIKFIEEACRVIPQGRLIGWDVALTPNGFDLIEANYQADPGFMQAPQKKGLKKAILNQL